ncbi:hypothetical protein B0H17DRAFT_1202359 [Mycena rosella]|uniref:F-box domain-containing protein n=1 Tax=Mycena rosella TaxID=1033263 RepID=A0AAD7GDF8_MYCRO|nr:hypothetical protein B0H17DRAFT_1202359 [Mycena rosella]
MSRNCGPFASPFSRDEMLTLTELPLDNLIQILIFTEPTAIFSFGQTCKKFLEITLTRTVWMNAVRRMCELNGLFKPSFPLDDMSLPELQYAAVSATWFTTRLHKQKGDATSVSLDPFVRRVFTPRVVKSSNVASEKSGAVKKLALVPGGRFLIIATDALIHLWDLGHSARKLIKPHALASIALPAPGSEPSIFVLPIADGKGIEVMVNSHNVEAKSWDFTVYHIFPSDTHPEFISVSEPPDAFTSQLHDVAVRGGPPELVAFLAKPGYCLFICMKLIFVWSTARNLWAGWKTDQALKRVFVYEDTIIGISATNIMVWEMPTPHSDTWTGCIIGHRPILTLTHPFPNLELEISTSASWLSATGQPCFLFITGWNGQERRLARYMMQFVDRGANINLPRILPILMDTALISTPQDGPSLGEIQLCGQNMFCLWTTPTAPKVEVQISAIPKERTEAGPALRPLRLFEDEWSLDPTPFDFSLCPVTGRLCTMNAQHNEILVLDFLIPTS